uniref:Beta-carotene isomerase D27-like C-terminal domain-containing protein n=1 Tax=Oryza brachyantha TaxID=4533 RepID=J3M3P1_ORYBR
MAMAITDDGQSAAHLVSAATITYAFAVHRAAAAAQPLLLLRPWFAVLVASTAVDRLSCVAFGIIAERDFVVQLAGADRPVALAKANATLSRVDLLCETAGASAFALLLAKNDPLTCIKLSCVISLCALPLLIFMGGEMNRLADGIFDHSENTASRNAAPTFSVEKTVETVRQGWSEYVRQPVLPASLAYVLVCFNVALAPGALMTTFLIHQGDHHDVITISDTIIEAPLANGVAFLRRRQPVGDRRFRRRVGGGGDRRDVLDGEARQGARDSQGSSALVSCRSAGAAGLVAQSVPLGAAVVVYLTGTVTRRGALFVFLGLIVASRAGHMAYSAVGLQADAASPARGKAAREHQPSFADDLLLAFFRAKMVEEVGWDSEKPGYTGLIEVANRLMTRGKSALETEQSAVYNFLLSIPNVTTWAQVRVLQSLFPPLLLVLFKALLAPIADGQLASMMVGEFTGSHKLSPPPLVFVEKCKYLEESKCLGICINTCKLPTQSFFNDHMGVDLYMEPNFEDYSCQFNFGVPPPPLDTDKALKEPCLDICTNARRRRELGNGNSTEACRPAMSRGEGITVNLERMARRLMQRQEAAASDEERRMMVSTHRVSPVPAHLRDANPDAYTPRFVSVGPLHRGDARRLGAGERLKMAYLHSLISRGHPDQAGQLAVIQEYLRVVAARETDARAFYGEDVVMYADDFIQMLVLDGCFIIEHLANVAIGREEASLHATPFGPVQLSVDLILAENQIPFFVLIDLVRSTKLPEFASTGYSPEVLLMKLVLYYLAGEKGRDMGHDALPSAVDGIAHILHLLHATVTVARTKWEPPPRIQDSAVLGTAQEVGAASGEVELERSYLGRMMVELRDRSRHPLFMMWADVKRNYFTVPWAVVAEFVAFVTFVSTIVQMYSSFKSK